MSKAYNKNTGTYEVYSSKDGGMVPTGADLYECSCGQMRPWKEKLEEAHQHDRDYHKCECTKCIDYRKSLSRYK